MPSMQINLCKTQKTVGARQFKKGHLYKVLYNDTLYWGVCIEQEQTNIVHALSLHNGLLHTIKQLCGEFVDLGPLDVEITR